MKNDILNAFDVEMMVREFYKKAFSNPLLSPFFEGMDFESHLPHMLRFWGFILLDEAGYQTNVVSKHLHLTIEENHMSEWVKLFKATVNEYFEGEKADLAHQRAEMIGWTILSKINRN